MRLVDDQEVELAGEGGLALRREELAQEAQRAIATAAMNEQNSKAVRLAAFGSLADSAKVNANLLLSGQIDAMYTLIQSREADADLRQAAAGAYGALNLPSQRVKDLILDQAKS